MKTPRRFALPLAAAAALAGPALADESAFTSPQQAMAYLADALPKATAQNPDYRTLSDGTVSRWLTQTIRFAQGTVTMQEIYTQTKDGKTTQGAHAAAFALAEVAIAEFTEPGDVTPSGAASRGAVFSCLKPGCIAAEWGGQPSKADKTDISLQDDSTRAKILAAFQYLKGAK